jgi:hypothetical protein
MRKRLLFAAARGATTQRWGSIRQAWIAVTDLELISNDCRIHPDDEHLQYGPISSELRENATGDDPPADAFAIPNGSYWMRPEDSLRVAHDCDNELHRSLFLLILAEALADEGL